ncbi:Low affinity potassium transport system protein kup [compost metagenome]
MAFQFLRSVWGYSTLLAGMLLAPLLVIEGVFLLANLLKIHDGGWVPVALALSIMIVMWTWTRGSRMLREKTARHDIPLETFIRSIEKSTHAPQTVRGTAVFLTSVGDKAPAVLLHNIKHNHVLHEHNVILTVRTSEHPCVAEEDRVSLTKLSDSFTRLELCFGFMDEQNVSKALSLSKKAGFKFEIMQTSFYLGRRTLIGDPNSGLPRWQDKLYIALAGLGIDPSSYFKLPANRVVEIGEQVTI